MKIFRYSVLLLSILLFFSCAEDQPGPQVMKISQNSLHFSGKGGAWQITVNSNCEWKISGTTSWCTTDVTSGVKTGGFIVSVDTNYSGESRYAKLLLTCPQSQLELEVLQDSVQSEHHYVLPVIFHILYSNENDSVQNVEAEVIANLIAGCNDLYRNNMGSIDMDLELLPATEDPEGNPLEEEGIVRIYRSKANQMSCNEFMNSNKNEVALMWDLNKYINVFVYTFTESNTLGIAHLPYTPRENSLPGLDVNNRYYTQMPDYVRCISLNNTYIYEEGAVKTLAHELGHYLGLLHAFSENGCEETDFCEDTPTYNRTTYEEWISTLTPPLFFYDVVKRTNCSGESFDSHNIMDYDISYQDQFTADQYKRIRHVLENSPLIPGPKNIIITKAAATEDEIPPVRFME